MAIVVVALLVVEYQRQRDELVGNTRRVASNASALVHKEFEVAGGLLAGLSTSPSLRKGDLAAFHAQALTALYGQPISAVFLTDANGNLLVSTLRPAGSKLPALSDAESLKRLASGEELVVSNVHPGTFSKEPVISVLIPVWVGGRHAYNLGAAIYSRDFIRIFDSLDVRKGWIISVVDRSGKIVARSVGMARYAGVAANPELLARAARQDTGTYYGNAVDGTPIAAAYVRSNVTGWIFAVGVPESILMSELKRASKLAALTVSALLGLTLLRALMLSRRISRSITALRAPALALGAGGELVLPEFDVREAAEVADSLWRTSGMLQEARHKAGHDPLTGLANRRLFHELVNQQALLALRNGSALSLLYLDLDEFKMVNDLYGHTAGDELLVRIARAIESELRESDIAARLGGDEFAVALLGCGAEAATRIAQDLVALINLVTANERFARVSASIGVAEMTVSSDVESLIRRADEAMYRAKFAGKNRVSTKVPG